MFPGVHTFTGLGVPKRTIHLTVYSDQGRSLDNAHNNRHLLAYYRHGLIHPQVQDNYYYYM